MRDIALLVASYLAGRIGSPRNLGQRIADRVPDRPPRWQEPFWLAVIWALNPVGVTRMLVRHVRGLPLVEAPKRIPAPEINPEWAARRGRKEQ